MKYSVIFLNYDPENKKEWIDETRGRAQEVVRSYGEEAEFIEIRDLEGYVHAVNEGIRQSSGEYLFIMNDDVVINEPRALEVMARASQNNTIVSWRKIPFYMTGEKMPDGSFWCLPRTVASQLGPLDMAYAEGYGCDEIDYFYRAKQAGFGLWYVPINIKHFENKTYQLYFSKNKEAMTERNASIFFNKWKDALHLTRA